jgi:hypothetical protein
VLTTDEFFDELHVKAPFYFVALTICLHGLLPKAIMSPLKAGFMPSKFSSRISWREKLMRQQEAKIVDIPPRMQARFGKGKMLIPRPLDVNALIRRVPEGKLATVLQLRHELAKRSNVDVTCPLCTGIFVRISAEAAEEERRAGKKTVTSYWRVISSDGRLNPKFPGGVAQQSRMLSAEGHKSAPSNWQESACGR